MTDAKFEPPPGGYELNFDGKAALHQRAPYLRVAAQNFWGCLSLGAVAFLVAFLLRRLTGLTWITGNLDGLASGLLLFAAVVPILRLNAERVARGGVPMQVLLSASLNYLTTPRKDRPHRRKPYWFVGSLGALACIVLIAILRDQGLAFLLFDPSNLAAGCLIIMMAAVGIELEYQARHRFSLVGEWVRMSLMIAATIALFWAPSWVCDGLINPWIAHQKFFPLSASDWQILGYGEVAIGLSVILLFWRVRVSLGEPSSSGGSGGGSSLERVHQFNVGVAKTLSYGSDIINHASMAFISGLIGVFGWWAPDHYGWHFHGWWQALPYGVMAFGALGVWESFALIIAIIKPTPSAPPPTTPDTW